MATLAGRKVVIVGGSSGGVSIAAPAGLAHGAPAGGVL